MQETKHYKLSPSYANLCKFILSGKGDENFCKLIYGASLCALNKKDGSIVTIETTFRRLVSNKDRLRFKEKTPLIY